MDFDEYKPTLDRLVEAAEKSAVSAVQLSEQLKGVDGRLTRVESAIEALLRNDKALDDPKHKAEICPFGKKFEEYDRTLFGDKDVEGYGGRLTRLEKQVNFWKGATYIVGTVAILSFPTMVTLIIAFLKHVT